MRTAPAEGFRQFARGALKERTSNPETLDLEECSSANSRVEQSTDLWIENAQAHAGGASELGAPIIQPFEPISHLLGAECVNQFGQSPNYLPDREHLLMEDHDAGVRSFLCNPSLLQWNEVANVIGNQNTACVTCRFQLGFVVHAA